MQYTGFPAPSHSIWWVCIEVTYASCISEISCPWSCRFYLSCQCMYGIAWWECLQVWKSKQFLRFEKKLFSLVISTSFTDEKTNKKFTRIICMQLTCLFLWVVICAYIYRFLSLNSMLTMSLKLLRDWNLPVSFLSSLWTWVLKDQMFLQML